MDPALAREIIETMSNGGGSMRDAGLSVAEGSWCTCPVDPAQLALFETESVSVGLRWHWPLVETSYTARVGFWYRRTPAVFGHRRNVGPLIICPDTNVLISLYENLDVVEEAIGLIGGPLVADEWPRTADALRDLLGLWWWRDVRFWGDPSLHLSDARRAIRADRLRAREIALEQLAQDFFERGGFDCVLPDNVRPVDPVCAMHPEQSAPIAPPPTIPARWPKAGLDRRLLQGALDSGCHVFLSEDRDVLKSHASLRVRGMAVLSPRQLLTELDAVGEFEPVRSVYGPAPDLSALARFYSLRAPGDA